MRDRKESLDLSSFYLGHRFCDDSDLDQVFLFELNGIHRYDPLDETHDFRKCKIRVSPHRFLEATIMPNEFYASLFAVTSLNEVRATFRCPVNLQEKGEYLLFDAWDFLLFQKINIVPCELDLWRDFKKKHIYLNDVVTYSGSDGLCKFDYFEEDDVYYSEAYYSPGRLTICGHPIDAIRWGTSNEDISLMNSVISDSIEIPFNYPVSLVEKDWNSVVEHISTISYELESFRIISSGIAFYVYENWTDSTYKCSIKTAGESFTKDFSVSRLVDALKYFPNLMAALKNDELNVFLEKGEILGIFEL